jgi:hypothetical protein
MKITIEGEEKSLLDWSVDPRCQVSIQTLRNRSAEGIRGISLLRKQTEVGRPKLAVDQERLSMIQEMDQSGKPLSEINARLKDAGKPKLSQHEWLHIQPENQDSTSIDRILMERPTSTWARSQLAKELSVPLSVVWRLCR